MVEELLRRPFVPWMYHDAFNVPGDVVDGDLLDMGLLRDCMSSGNHPLRSNQYAMPFARQVDEGRKFGRRNPIP